MTSPRYTAPDTARRDAGDRQDPVDPRCPFEVDRARIVHSSAFRRLQGKTQIFGVGEGDFFRTRLTHSMEAAQIGKGLVLFLNRLPELADAPIASELVEAACLAHDLGHPPFGHNGEAALQVCMRHAGGFEGNAQNLRILTRLEAKRDGHGLDLTRATLEGLLKYLTPYSARKLARSAEAASDSDPSLAVEKCYYDDDEMVIQWIRNGDNRIHRTLESEIMEWADDIAYSVHDLEDGLHSGLILAEHFDNQTYLERIALYAQRKGAPLCTPEEVQTLMREVLAPLRGGTARQLKQLRKGVTSRLIHTFITQTDVARRPGDAAYPLHLTVPFPIKRQVAIMMGVEYVLMIRHPRVTTLEYRGKRVVTGLFAAFAQDDSGDLFPEDVRESWDEVRHDEPARLRVACDYIAGMTDAHALRLYSRLYEPSAAGPHGLD